MVTCSTCCIVCPALRGVGVGARCAPTPRELYRFLPLSCAGAHRSRPAASITLMFCASTNCLSFYFSFSSTSYHWRQAPCVGRQLSCVLKLLSSMLCIIPLTRRTAACLSIITHKSIILCPKISPFDKLRTGTLLCSSFVFSWGANPLTKSATGICGLSFKRLRLLHSSRKCPWQ